MTWRKFPIKFYKEDDKVVYESAFTFGEAPTLELALKELTKTDFVNDLFYYFDDVMDVKIDGFAPALNHIKKKKRDYLGEIPFHINIDKKIAVTNPFTSLSMLQNDKEALAKHLKNIKKDKLHKNMMAVFEKIKKGINNILDKINLPDNLRLPVSEMFDPIKTYRQLVCEHCGRVIPISTYYEYYQDKPYHLECIWDKLVNHEDKNSYESAERFFWSLQEYVGKWPGNGFDNEEDYLIDQDLVRANGKIIHRTPMEECTTRKLNRLIENYLTEEDDEKTI